MSGYQVTATIGPLEVAIDSRDGLLIDLADGISWMSLQEARELLGFLQDNLSPEPDHDTRGPVRQILDRPTKGSIDR